MAPLSAPTLRALQLNTKLKELSSNWLYLSVLIESGTQDTSWKQKDFVNLHYELRYKIFVLKKYSVICVVTQPHTMHVN